MKKNSNAVVALFSLSLCFLMSPNAFSWYTDDDKYTEPVMLGENIKDGEKLQAFLCQRKTSKSSYRLIIENNGSRPIRLNYYSDNFVFIGFNRKMYEADKAISSYPETINPDRFRGVELTLQYPSLEALEGMSVILGLEDRSIPLYLSAVKKENVATDNDKVAPEEHSIYIDYLRKKSDGEGEKTGNG